MDIQAIHNEAKTAAIQAENDHIAKYGESYYCGFAWVDDEGVPPGNNH